MNKKYIRVEPEKPDIGLQLLNEGITKALQDLPIADTESVASELSKIREGIETLADQQRASQEASKAHQQEMVVALKEIATIKLEASQEVSEPVDVEALLKGMAELIPEPAPVMQQETVDVEGIVEKVFMLANKKPSYTFEIERNHSGLLTGIRATPSDE